MTRSEPRLPAPRPRRHRLPRLGCTTRCSSGDPMPSRVPAIAFIGGGPRTAGVLERLAASRPRLFQGPLHIHVVEPYEPGSGRIWRYDQSPGLLLNSTAADV